MPARERPVSAAVQMNAHALAVLAGTAAIGAGLGALIATRSRGLGAIIGGALGAGIPVVSTLLILLPLRRLTAKETTT